MPPDVLVEIGNLAHLAGRRVGALRIGARLLFGLLGLAVVLLPGHLAAAFAIGTRLAKPLQQTLLWRHGAVLVRLLLLLLLLLRLLLLLLLALSLLNQLFQVLDNVALHFLGGRAGVLVAESSLGLAHVFADARHEFLDFLFQLLGIDLGFFLIL